MNETQTRAKATAGNSIRVLIVDDEPLARRAVRQLLGAHQDIEVVGECADAIDAAELLTKRTVDLVLLDIRMPAISGLTLAHDIQTRPLVVFVTAHEEHGAAAFDIGAADYIVKPVTAKRLDVALQRVRERLAQLDDSARPNSANPNHANTLERLVVRVGSKDVVVLVDDVELFAADDVHVSLHVAGRRYEMRITLDRLAKQLDPARFVRIHRSYVVPIRGIVAVHHKRNGEATIELRNGASVPVSRRRRTELARLQAAAERG
ncbi:MAG: LytTR family DNA-binding domain-containing protein [Gemmatimonadaceae bacterium]